jgi:hypothetical protein
MWPRPAAVPASATPFWMPTGSASGRRCESDSAASPPLCCAKPRGPLFRGRGYPLGGARRAGTDLCRLPGRCPVPGQTHSARGAEGQGRPGGLAARTHRRPPGRAHRAAGPADPCLPSGRRLRPSRPLCPLGEVLRQRLRGWRAAVFTGNPELGLTVALHRH